LLRRQNRTAAADEVGYLERARLQLSKSSRFVVNVLLYAGDE
jgi:hypothetical protein